MSSVAAKKTQDNMNQKLALVIKSGKYRLGKLATHLVTQADHKLERHHAAKIFH